MTLDIRPYHDRMAAGRLLARQLAHYASRVDTLVLAIPRGGVPVALEVASYLNAPLDAFVVRRIALPDAPHVALGALAPGGVTVYDDQAITDAGVSARRIAEITAQETSELKRTQEFYRCRRPLPRIAGRVVILIDEGLAAGLAMHAAVIALLRQQPAWLVVAAPVGAPEACDELAQEVHELVCPLRPQPFQSVGLWYERFTPEDDDQLRAAIRRTSGLPSA
jgi:putative phosphoribosyl transferase